MLPKVKFYLHHCADGTACLITVHGQQVVNVAPVSQDEGRRRARRIPRRHWGVKVTQVVA